MLQLSCFSFSWLTMQSDLQDKSIRAGHMTTLVERFELIPVRTKSSDTVARAAPSRDVGSVRRFSSQW